MLNKAMLLNSADSRMGWYVTVTKLQGGSPVPVTMVGGNSEENIIPFGGAPNITAIQTMNIVNITGVTQSEGLSIKLGDSIHRDDTNLTVTFTNEASDTSLWSSQNSPNFFTDSDVGKTVTVYYLPA